MIRNPVLPGFRPDPSIVRVGDDYYIATSTFEWFPGVALHHSRDLMHWRPVGHALTRPSQLDLRGVPDSGGVWAPSLSYADGRFWLVFATMHHTGLGLPFKDLTLSLITAPRIEGPWSDPVTLAGSGFDPSLFHDDDGRKWLLNIEWDFRNGRQRFAGIVMQEFDAEAGRMVGPVTPLLQKTQLTEGPNLYRHDGWYYLMLAEGGTGWNHGISMARARHITGPYELDPAPAVLTTRDDYGHPLQKAGHGELVQTQAGEWYLAHLASRPITPERRCVLGRETCLQKVHWSADGWLRLAGGGHHPQLYWPAPAGLAPSPWPDVPARDDFDAAALGPQWQSLRQPIRPQWLSLTERAGWLRLRGGHSLHSAIAPTLVAQRLQSLQATVTTVLEFQPTHFTQMAGLVCYYSRRHHAYLRVTHDDQGVSLGLVQTERDDYTELATSPVPVADWSRFHLRARIDHASLRFSASPDGQTWHDIGPTLDMSRLSDDHAAGFTGAMVGLTAQDLRGTLAAADFDHFSVEPLDH